MAIPDQDFRRALREELNEALEEDAQLFRHCHQCSHWRPDPLWKQVLFFWRGGLWQGRCERDCRPGVRRLWHGLTCGMSYKLDEVVSDLSRELVNPVPDYTYRAALRRRVEELERELRASYTSERRLERREL